MEENSLLDFLKSNLAKLDGGATYTGTYGSIPAYGLFTAQLTNRPSKSWPKAQYLYTSTKEQGDSLNKCLEKWVMMCAYYNNQYLIIKDENNDYYLYDYKGDLLASNDQILPKIELLLGKQRVLIFNDNKQLDIKLLRAMRTKPFLLLAGISGTGKSRIVKQMAFDSCPNDLKLRNDATTPGNYCLIEVKPNWHDSSELIGYASQIGHPHYEVTPFVRFLAKAMLYEEQRVPFFVCLDEMNLAPVEQYFAEFLSVLESRKVVNARITSEALIPAEVFANAKYERQLKEDLFGLEVKKVSEEKGHSVFDGELADEELAVYNKLKEFGLRIPSNLIVIGTVNMDETTHQFSRKVIDRAMTIEMNLPEGDPFLDFFNNARDLEYTDTPVSSELFLPTIVKAADAVDALTADNAAKTEWLKKEVAKILTDLNAALEDTPFKIAYRVQNELMIYFYELWNENKDAEWGDILNQSVDQILMMKVLPRIEGDEDLLEKPLASLANFCAPYPKATVKVAEMKNRLERAHFTSYWP